jgi:hypothetical protein
VHVVCRASHLRRLRRPLVSPQLLATFPTPSLAGADYGPYSTL